MAVTVGSFSDPEAVGSGRQQTRKKNPRLSEQTLQRYPMSGKKGKHVLRFESSKGNGSTSDSKTDKCAVGGSHVFPLRPKRPVVAIRQIQARDRRSR